MIKRFKDFINENTNPYDYAIDGAKEFLKGSKSLLLIIAKPARHLQNQLEYELTELDFPNKKVGLGFTQTITKPTFIDTSNFNLMDFNEIVPELENFAKSSKQKLVLYVYKSDANIFRNIKNAVILDTSNL